MERLLGIIEDRPAAVFWSCSGEQMLFEHLRRLNNARLLAWEIQDECYAGNPDPGHEEAINQLGNGIEKLEELESQNCPSSQAMS